MADNHTGREGLHGQGAGVGNGRGRLSSAPGKTSRQRPRVAWRGVQQGWRGWVGWGHLGKQRQNFNEGSMCGARKGDGKGKRSIMDNGCSQLSLPKYWGGK